MINMNDINVGANSSTANSPLNELAANQSSNSAAFGGGSLMRGVGNPFGLPTASANNIDNVFEAAPLRVIAGDPDAINPLRQYNPLSTDGTDEVQRPQGTLRERFEAARDKMNEGIHAGFMLAGITGLVMTKIGIANFALQYDLVARAAKTLLSALADIAWGEGSIEKDFDSKPLPASMQQTLAAYQRLKKMVINRLEQVLGIKLAAQPGESGSPDDPNGQAPGLKRLPFSNGAVNQIQQRLRVLIGEALRLIQEAIANPAAMIPLLRHAEVILDRAEAFAVVKDAMNMDANGDLGDFNAMSGLVYDQTGGPEKMLIEQLKKLIEVMLRSGAPAEELQSLYTRAMATVPVTSAITPAPQASGVI